jgi:hypothetical protein
MILMMRWLQLRCPSIPNWGMSPFFVYGSDLRMNVNACSQSARVAAHVPSLDVVPRAYTDLFTLGVNVIEQFERA